MSIIKRSKDKFVESSIDLRSIIKDNAVNQILLSDEALGNVCSEIDEKNKKNDCFSVFLSAFISITICLAGSIFSNTNIFMDMIGYLANGGNSFQIFSALIFYATIIADIVLAVLILIKWKTRKRCDIYESIVSKSKSGMNYTAIFIIVDKTDTGDKFLIGDNVDERHKNYLPFIKLNCTQALEGHLDNARTYLRNNYKINDADIIDLRFINRTPYYSIKSEDNTNYKQHAYFFISVKFNNGLRKSFTTSKGFNWLTIDEMKNNLPTITCNKDVVDLLLRGEVPSSDSFELRGNRLSIIWNITKKCCYKCAICATHDDDKNELSKDDKQKVLMRLFEARDRIGHIDFAGGDPLSCEDSMEIINYAINMFGTSSVSVTTTGAGIKSRSGDERKVISHGCEITLDIAAEDSAAEDSADKMSRNENEYVVENFTQSLESLFDTRHITVNMPIINDTLSEKDIDNLVCQIEEIKKANENSEISLKFIRLMPVGKLNNGYPKEYDPIKLIQDLKQKLQPIIDVSDCFHCSLRVIKELNPTQRPCGMLHKKIGIDCEGNVYACAWAAYLLNSATAECFKRKEDNPFYVGNLIEKPLKEILHDDNQKYKRIKQRFKSSSYFCPLVSYALNGIWYANHDPLAKE